MAASQSADSKELHHDAMQRRASVMTVEASLSPVPSSAGSISEASFDDDYTRNFPEPKLTPQLSRTSSTGAVGGIVPSSEIHQTYTNRSVATTTTLNDPAFEVDFDDEGNTNPQFRSIWFKSIVLAVMSYGTTCVVLYSTSYTSAIPGLISTFGISDNTGILGMTTYLIGIAVGALVLAPLSEMYGRRPIYIVALGLFVVTVLPCALAKNIEAILIPRFFSAFCAAAMVSNAPGTVNDIFNEKYRALAFSVWSIGPMNGPVLGPVVGGFVFEYLGWRWTNWIVAICAGAAFFMVALIPETYAPALLRSRAAKKRKETGDSRWWSRYDEKAAFLPLLKINLSRPFVLTVTEPICIFWDLYVALVYGILYLCFVAYPIVFGDIRGWSPGFQGLAFSGIGIGSMVVICGEPLIRKLINAHRVNPETGIVPPEAMVSIICIAAILIPAGEIWFAWTGPPPSHWLLPIAAGILFGAGNGAVFIYASNYLVHSYGIYAASALAGNAVLRSVLGATLPLAGPALYNRLGAHWAGTLLALLEAACIPIPFVFYKYGHRIRQKSTLIRKMREDRQRQEEKRQRAEEKIMKRTEAANKAGAGLPGGAFGALDEAVDEEKGMGYVNKAWEADTRQ